MKIRELDIPVNLRGVAKIVLLRHAHSTANSAGVLSGQLPGVSLSKVGQRQSRELIQRLGSLTFDSIRVSPMQRCEETIQPWVNSFSITKRPKYIFDEGLIEMDYGSWSGKKLSSLSLEPLWKRIQESPSKVKFPEGESFLSMHRRSLASVEIAHAKKKSGIHLFVTHGDVIKSMIAGLIGLKLDQFQNLVIDPASFTVLDFDGKVGRLVVFNDTISDISKKVPLKVSPKKLLGGGSGTPRGPR